MNLRSHEREIARVAREIIRLNRDITAQIAQHRVWRLGRSPEGVRCWSRLEAYQKRFARLLGRHPLGWAIVDGKTYVYVGPNVYRVIDQEFANVG